LFFVCGCAAARLSGPAAPGEAKHQTTVEHRRALAAEQRVAVLEARLARLEQRASVETSSASEQLERLIAAQERLVDQMTKSQAAPRLNPGTSAAPTELCGQTPFTGAAPGTVEAYLRDLIERAESDAPSWRGGLSREKREALRTLLRPERRLDARNPMDL
jgi:hypothetical protein